MTENNLEVNNKLRILENEFDRVGNIIESYANRQLNFMNFFIIIIGSSFIYLHEKELLNNYLQLYPYFLFLVYGLWGVEFQRMNVYNGYMMFIEEEINKIINENILHSRRITSSFISNWKINKLYLLYIVIWLAIFLALYIFSHKDSNFMNMHALMQLLIMIIFAIVYMKISLKLPHEVKTMCINNKQLKDESIDENSIIKPHNS